MNGLFIDLSELVAIPSFSGEEAAAADWFAQKLKQQGCEVYTAFHNVWTCAHGYDPALPTVLLNSHLDTVKVCNGWIINPHKLTDSCGKWFGLGINDASASLVGLMHVFLEEHQQRIAGKRPTYNLILLASAEEEISGARGMEYMVDKLGKVDMAIVGEPTGGKVAVAEKGLLVIDGFARGVAGHAARNTGENAIVTALEDIQAIHAYRFAKHSEWLGPVKATVTVVHGGHLHNVIPDSCEFVVDVRLNECYTHEEVLELLQSVCKSTLKARSIRLKPSALPANHVLQRTAEKLKLQCVGSPTLSDQALMPWPSVKLGIGESERSHTANEFIYPEELVNGVELYRQFLTQLEYEIMG